MLDDVGVHLADALGVRLPAPGRFLGDGAAQPRLRRARQADAEPPRLGDEVPRG